MNNRFYNFTNKAKDKIGRKLASLFNIHSDRIFPYSEEDKEGVITWETPKKCRMLFKDKTVAEGYLETINRFKKLKLDKYVMIYIEGEKVVVVLP